MAKRKSSKIVRTIFKAAVMIARQGTRRDVLKDSKKSKNMKKLFKAVEK